VKNEDFYVCRDCHQKLHVSTSVKDASRKRGIMERCQECDRKRKKAHRDSPVTGPAQRVKVRNAMRALNRERRAAGTGWSDSLTEEQLEAKRAGNRRYNREKRWASIGASPEYYAEQFARQGGRCAMCGTDKPARGRSGKEDEYFCIDHCHKTGALRGLLCSDCNLIIGHANDDPERLRAGIAYLGLYEGQGRGDPAATSTVPGS
jgi:hypothetical protein